jgi:hypothetical protein
MIAPKSPVVNQSERKSQNVADHPATMAPKPKKPQPSFSVYTKGFRRSPSDDHTLAELIVASRQLQKNGI